MAIIHLSIREIRRNHLARQNSTPLSLPLQWTIAKWYGIIQNSEQISYCCLFLGVFVAFLPKIYLGHQKVTDRYIMAGSKFMPNVVLDSEQEHLKVFPPSGNGRRFDVRTIHISCKSNPYSGSQHKYGGIIIYGRDGFDDWYTANGTHCKSGYVVIMQTDTQEFQELQKKWQNEPGKVHGIIYKKAFGESCNQVDVVGEGFGIIDGEFKTISNTFHPFLDDDNKGNPDDKKHRFAGKDGNKHGHSLEMHPESKKCVEKVVEWWKRAGSNFLERQNHAVKSLFSSDEE